MAYTLEIAYTKMRGYDTDLFARPVGNPMRSHWNPILKALKVVPGHALRTDHKWLEIPVVDFRAVSCDELARNGLPDYAVATLREIQRDVASEHAMIKMFVRLA